MKQTAKLFGVAAVAISVVLLALPALAFDGHGSGRGGGGGVRGDFHGGGGFGGGFHCLGCSCCFFGWVVCYPWGFSYVYAPPPYYYYDGYYYDPPATYYPAPVVYSSQPTVVYTSPPPAPASDNAQQPAGDRPLSPTAVDRDSTPQRPAPAPKPENPPPVERSDQGPSTSVTSVADVKALAKAGLSDDVILSHLRNSRAVYHLTTSEIIDLKQSGVSEKIIDFMINTGGR
jgi:hypothetical protein